jgi:hypothetical protein
MPKEIVSQVMQQTCDGCGAIKTWELIGADQNETILGEMQEWYQVGRKILAPNGQLVQLNADACSLACVPVAAIKKLVLPKFEEPVDNIDLAALRINQAPN